MKCHIIDSEMSWTSSKTTSLRGNRFLIIIVTLQLQGSICGPLGFMINITDIPKSVSDLLLILYEEDIIASTSHQHEFILTLNNITSNWLSKLNTYLKSS